MNIKEMYVVKKFGFVEIVVKGCTNKIQVFLSKLKMIYYMIENEL